MSREQAWNGFAAAASLGGAATVAAWAGLEAAAVSWTAATLTNAGVYLFEAHRDEEALQFLTCAEETGYASPYLLEALAVVSAATGDVARAREHVIKAQQASPDDRLLEVEASFITSGRPPAERPGPPGPDPLDEAIRELERQAEDARRTIARDAAAIDASIPGAAARNYAQIASTAIDRSLSFARDRAGAARTAATAARPSMVASALAACVSAYAQIVDERLTFPSTTETNGSPLLFWAEVIGASPASLHREQDAERDAIRWAMHGGGPALAQPAWTAYVTDRNTGQKDHAQRLTGCRDPGCTVRENARWCGVREQLYDRFETGSRQRYNLAARAFDGAATRHVIVAENEYAGLRAYAVRQLKRINALAPPGAAAFARGVNESLQRVYRKHFAAATGNGVVSYVGARAAWFNEERSDLERMLAQDARLIETECAPVERAMLELIAQEQWQAYLDHLHDRMAGDIDASIEDELPCEGSIGPMTATVDLNKPGEGRFDLKWKGALLQGGGGVIVGSGGVNVGGTVGVGRTSSDRTAGVSVGPYADTTGGEGMSGSGSYGPFAGKAKITLTSRVDPWNAREYLGIKLKGSAGMSLKSGKLGVACYPSGASITVYPRALYEDAVRYLSEWATGGRRD